jgi:hypothetical protein
MKLNQNLFENSIDNIEVPLYNNDTRELVGFLKSKQFFFIEKNKFLKLYI